MSGHDGVKTTLANCVQEWLVAGMQPYVHQVPFVCTRLSALETEVKVLVPDQPPRYFTVKVKEVIQ